MASLFAPHGRVTFERHGQRLFIVAEGPFNQELAQSIVQESHDWCHLLRAGGAFDHLSEFRESALASPEALRVFGQMLQQLVAQGVAPQHTAYVFPPDLEGGRLIQPLFERAFAAAGLSMRVFATRAEALSWLDAGAAHR